MVELSTTAGWQATVEMKIHQRPPRTLRLSMGKLTAFSHEEKTATFLLEWICSRERTKENTKDYNESEPPGTALYRTEIQLRPRGRGRRTISREELRCLPELTRHQMSRVRLSLIAYSTIEKELVLLNILCAINLHVQHARAVRQGLVRRSITRVLSRLVLKIVRWLSQWTKSLFKNSITQQAMVDSDMVSCFAP